MVVAGIGQGGAPARVGPYRIVRRLSAGGMGAVYLGHDEVTGMWAAVKLIWPEYAAGQDFRGRLRREVAAAGRVPRFCTAPLLAADVDADAPWLATEFIDGPTLELALRRERRLHGAGLEAFAVGVAVALRAIHQHGVVHRDLKPSNILLSRHGPRVIDFGVARLAGSGAQLTAVGMLVGTPGYMAPEQLRGERPTAAVDVFTWASVVVYAATGQPPFGSGREAMGRILREQPDLGPLADPLRGLVAAAFAKDPARRPSSPALVDLLLRGMPAIASRVLATAAVPAATRPHRADPEPVGDPRAGFVVPPPPGPVVRGPASPLVPPPPGPVVRGSAGPVVRGSAGPVPPAPCADHPSATFADPGPPRARQRPSRGTLAGTAAGAVAALTIAALVSVPWLVDRGDRPAGPGSPSADVVTAPQGRRHGDHVAPGPPEFGTPVVEPLTGHSGIVDGVAVGAQDGTLLAASAGWHHDGTVRIWDLAAEKQLHKFAGHTGAVSSVDIGRLDGVPIAVSGGTYDKTTKVLDHTIRVWDLAAGEQIGVLEGHTDMVEQLVLGEVAGTPVVVSASKDRTVRMWDLDRMEQWGQPLSGHTQPVHSVALGKRNGVPIAVSGGRDGTVRVWNLERRAEIAVLEGHTGSVWSVAVGEVDGEPVAVSGGDGSDDSIRVWDLGSLEPLASTVDSHQSKIISVATGEVGGTPVVVSAGSSEQTIKMWRLPDMELIAQSAVDHRNGVWHVAIGELDGVPVAVTGGGDSRVGVWSIAPAEPAR